VDVRVVLLHEHEQLGQDVRVGQGLHPELLEHGRVHEGVQLLQLLRTERDLDRLPRLARLA